MSERRRLPCCLPYGTYFPSGYAKAHASWCKARDSEGHLRRGQKVEASEWLPDPDCPRHPGEEYVGCRACERVAEDAIQSDEMWEAME
jgi:hypothetical protein